MIIIFLAFFQGYIVGRIIFGEPSPDHDFSDCNETYPCSLEGCFETYYKSSDVHDTIRLSKGVYEISSSTVFLLNKSTIIESDGVQTANLVGPLSFIIPDNSSIDVVLNQVEFSNSSYVVLFSYEGNQTSNTSIQMKWVKFTGYSSTILYASHLRMFSVENSEIGIIEDFQDEPTSNYNESTMILKNVYTLDFTNVTFIGEVKPMSVSEKQTFKPRIWIEGGIFRATFKNVNIRNVLGGGFFFQDLFQTVENNDAGGTVSFYNSSFRYCENLFKGSEGSDDYNRGGAIFVRGTTSNTNFPVTLTVQGCEFSDNNAVRGGSLYAENLESVHVVDTKFNFSRADVHGGGLYFLTILQVYVSSTTFSDCSAGINGAGMFVYGKIGEFFGGLNVSNSTFSMNTAENSGGGLGCIFNEFCSVVDSEFHANAASSGSGGAMIFLSYFSHVGGSLFFENFAGGDGGASYHESCVHVLFENCVFEKNHLGLIHFIVSGGAIFVWEVVTFTLKGSVFRDSVAEVGAFAADGGAICIYEFSEIAVEGCHFENGVAHRGGGVSFSEGEENARVSIIDSVFVNNRAEAGFFFDWGGAVFMEGTYLDIRNCSFEGNIGGSGGAVTILEYYNSILEVTISDSNFVRNQASMGGAIFAGPITGDFKLQNIVFDGNVAFNPSTDVGGGALAFGLIGRIFISNCTMKNNSAIEAGGGGAIYGEIVNFFSVEDSIVKDNKGCVTGAIHLVLATYFTAKTTTFSNNNSSGRAGAIYLQSSGDVVFEESNFFNNPSVDNGGGLVVFQANSLSISCSVFENNWSRSNGGALMIQSVNFTIIDECQFNENQAYIRGSAAYILNSTEISIRNTSLQRNYAGVGGVFFQICGSVVIENNELVNNSAVWGGGYYLDRVEDVLVWNSSFANHTVQKGGGMYLTKVQKFTSEHCTFSYNTASEYGAGLFLVYVEESRFKSCKMNGNFGYMSNALSIWLSGSVFLENMDIFENVGHYYGITITNISHVYVGRSNFTKNWANGSGSGIHVQYGESVVMEDLILKENRGRFGAGVSLSKILFAQLSRIHASENYVTDNGAAISVWDCPDVTLENSIFEDNHADIHGTVEFETYDPEYLTIGEVKDCVFKRNRAEGFGGALHVASSVSVFNSSFVENSVGDGGGAAIFAVHTFTEGNSTELIMDLTISHCSFERNRDDSGSPSYGTTILVQNFEGLVHISDLEIVDSQEYGIFKFSDVQRVVLDRIYIDGGVNAILAYTCREIEIRDCVFSNIRADPEVLGSPLMFESISEKSTEYSYAEREVYTKGISITNSMFMNNYGYFGGAVNVVDNSLLFLKDCIFVNNTAEQKGGAVFTKGDMYAYIEKLYPVMSGKLVLVSPSFSPGCVIQNCSFLGNQGKHGGSIYSIGLNNLMMIKGSTFEGGSSKESGDDIRVDMSGYLMINGSSFRESFHQSGENYEEQCFSQDCEQIVHSSVSVEADRTNSKKSSIYVTQTRLIVHDSTQTDMSDNGISIYGGSVEIINSTFSNFSGGRPLSIIGLDYNDVSQNNMILAMSEVTYGLVKDVVVNGRNRDLYSGNGNLAVNGGCIFIADTKTALWLDNVKLVDCEAEYGGCMYLENNLDLLFFSNILLEKCKASYGGGVCYKSSYVEDVILNNETLPMIVEADQCESTFGGDVLFKLDASSNSDENDKLKKSVEILSEKTAIGSNPYFIRMKSISTVSGKITICQEGEVVESCSDYSLGSEEWILKENELVGIYPGEVFNMKVNIYDKFENLVPYYPSLEAEIGTEESQSVSEKLFSYDSLQSFAKSDGVMEEDIVYSSLSVGRNGISGGETDRLVIVVSSQEVDNNFNMTTILLPCPPGTFVSRSEQMSEEQAEDGIEYEICTICENGFYSVISNSKKCHECPSEYAKCTISTVIPNAGYWADYPPFTDFRFSSNSDENEGIVHIHECVNGKCLGGNGVSNSSVGDINGNNCDESYDPYSPGCGSCLDGYSPWNNGCVLCEENGYAESFLFWILFFIIFVSLFHCNIQDRKSRIESIILFYGLISSLILPHVSWLGDFQVVSGYFFIYDIPVVGRGCPFQRTNISKLLMDILFNPVVVPTLFFACALFLFCCELCCIGVIEPCGEKVKKKLNGIRDVESSGEGDDDGQGEVEDEEEIFEEDDESSEDEEDEGQKDEPSHEDEEDEGGEVVGDTFIDSDETDSMGDHSNLSDIEMKDQVKPNEDYQRNIQEEQVPIGLEDVVVDSVLPTTVDEDSSNELDEDEDDDGSRRGPDTHISSPSTVPASTSGEGTMTEKEDNKVLKEQLAVIALGCMYECFHFENCIYSAFTFVKIYSVVVFCVALQFLSCGSFYSDEAEEMELKMRLYSDTKCFDASYTAMLVFTVLVVMGSILICFPVVRFCILICHQRKVDDYEEFCDSDKFLVKEEDRRSLIMNIVCCRWTVSWKKHYTYMVDTWICPLKITKIFKSKRIRFYDSFILSKLFGSCFASLRGDLSGRLFFEFYLLYRSLILVLFLVLGRYFLLSYFTDYICVVLMLVFLLLHLLLLPYKYWEENVIETLCLFSLLLLLFTNIFKDRIVDESGTITGIGITLILLFYFPMFIILVFCKLKWCCFVCRRTRYTKFFHDIIAEEYKPRKFTRAFLEIFQSERSERKEKLRFFNPTEKEYKNEFERDSEDDVFVKENVKFSMGGKRKLVRYNRELYLVDNFPTNEWGDVETIGDEEFNNFPPEKRIKVMNEMGVGVYARALRIEINGKEFVMKMFKNKELDYYYEEEGEDPQSEKQMQFKQMQFKQKYELIRARLSREGSTPIYHPNLMLRPYYVEDGVYDWRLTFPVNSQQYPRFPPVIEEEKAIEIINEEEIDIREKLFLTSGLMIMKKFEGNLGDYALERIESELPFSEMELVVMMGNILDGGFTLHSQGFVHRDLHPRNIFVRYWSKSSKRVLVIADFGGILHINMNDHGKRVWVRKKEEVSISFNQTRSSICGDTFSPPEANKEIVDFEKFDLYSIGMLGFYLSVVVHFRMTQSTSSYDGNDDNGEEDREEEEGEEEGEEEMNKNYVRDMMEDEKLKTKENMEIMRNKYPLISQLIEKLICENNEKRIGWDEAIEMKNDIRRQLNKRFSLQRLVQRLIKI